MVRTEGVSRLTLDEVARRADVSKGGLLYHFGTKRALIVALLTDTLDNADAELNRLAVEDRPGAFANAYLDFVRQGRHEKGAAAGVFAAAALDEGDLGPARDQFKHWHDRLVGGDGLDPTVGLLARVVADGLWFIDLFELAPPSAAERRRLFELVGQLLDES